MKIYTFQPLFVWDCLKDIGYYHPFFLENYLQNDDDEWGFSQAYSWLKQQMNNKNIQYENNNSHMIWGWYQWLGKKKCAPDKRYSQVKNFMENEFVMLEIDIDPKRVLLSDYEFWHAALSYWYLDKANITNKFEKIHNYYKEKPLRDKNGHNQLCKSWERIFDIENISKYFRTSKKNQCIQATFFELFYTDVRKVHFFNNGNSGKVIEVNV